MRPLVSKSEAFAPMTRMHTQIMIEEYRSIYDILENNARLESEFLFLMNLSSRIPPLQKHEYFLYIRDFMIDYDLRMRTSLQDIDTSIAMWNRFISIKNKTLI